MENPYISFKREQFSLKREEVVMYFNNIKTLDISSMICDTDNILAHIDGARIETLYDHSELSLLYFKKIISNKNLDIVFKKIENYILRDFSKEGIEIYKEMILNVIYLHDIGKISCVFQSKKMNNNRYNKYKGNKFNYSNHSMLSSILYIDQYFDRIKKHSTIEIGRAHV